MEAGMVAEADPMAAVEAASTAEVEVGFMAAEAGDSTVVAAERIAEAVALRRGADHLEAAGIAAG
jgi:hypothetical protein